MLLLGREQRHEPRLEIVERPPVGFDVGRARRRVAVVDPRPGVDDALRPVRAGRRRARLRRLQGGQRHRRLGRLVAQALDRLGLLPRGRDGAGGVHRQHHREIEGHEVSWISCAVR
ncbi:hypothetical protein [Methylobrevis pamukkalensis]|uniref:hypothetical protein n=1 Tax=Methylobrevis pamukkalensis TaxID=1439726 RepID=UPI001471C7F4|nr:hypothetical protein [Methylobrevis pamukkalensis]